ncbi:MAG: hypothetical protein ACO1N2_01790 [Candidatus Saccharimonadota bacterium]|jgi:hypothetical protein
MNTFTYVFLSAVAFFGPLVVAALCGWLTNSTGTHWFRGKAFSWVVAIFLAAASVAAGIAMATTLWTFANGEDQFFAWAGTAIAWAVGGCFIWGYVREQ